MDKKTPPKTPDQPETPAQPSDAPAAPQEQPDPMQGAEDAIKALHRKLDSEQTLQ